MAIQTSNNNLLEAHNFNDFLETGYAQIERCCDCIVETIGEYEKNFVRPKVQCDNPLTKKGRVSYQKKYI